MTKFPVQARPDGTPGWVESIPPSDVNTTLEFDTPRIRKGRTTFKFNPDVVRSPSESLRRVSPQSRDTGSNCQYSTADYLDSDCSLDEGSLCSENYACSENSDREGPHSNEGHTNGISGSDISSTVRRNYSSEEESGPTLCSRDRSPALSEVSSEEGSVIDSHDDFQDEFRHNDSDNINKQGKSGNEGCMAQTVYTAQETRQEISRFKDVKRRRLAIRRSSAEKQKGRIIRKLFTAIFPEAYLKRNVCVGPEHVNYAKVFQMLTIDGVLDQYILRGSGKFSGSSGPKGCLRGIKKEKLEKGLFTIGKKEELPELENSISPIPKKEEKSLNILEEIPLETSPAKESIIDRLKRRELFDIHSKNSFYSKGTVRAMNLRLNQIQQQRNAQDAFAQFIPRSVGDIFQQSVTQVDDLEVEQSENVEQSELSLNLLKSEKTFIEKRCLLSQLGEKVVSAFIDNDKEESSTALGPLSASSASSSSGVSSSHAKWEKDPRFPSLNTLSQESLRKLGETTVRECLIIDADNTVDSSQNATLDVEQKTLDVASDEKEDADSNAEDADSVVLEGAAESVGMPLCTSERGHHTRTLDITHSFAHSEITSDDTFKTKKDSLSKPSKPSQKEVTTTSSSSSSSSSSDNHKKGNPSFKSQPTLKLPMSIYVACVFTKRVHEVPDDIRSLLTQNNNASLPLLASLSSVLQGASRRFMMVECPKRAVLDQKLETPFRVPNEKWTSSDTLSLRSASKDSIDSTASSFGDSSLCFASGTSEASESLSLREPSPTEMESSSLSLSLTTQQVVGEQTLGVGIHENNSPKLQNSKNPHKPHKPTKSIYALLPKFLLHKLKAHLKSVVYWHPHLVNSILVPPTPLRIIFYQIGAIMRHNMGLERMKKIRAIVTGTIQIISGDEDKIVTTAESTCLAEGLSADKLVRFEKAGHQVNDTYPQAVSEVLVE